MVHRSRLGTSLVLLVCGLVCGLGGPSTRADDWPQFRGPNRDSRSAETGLLAEWPANGPELLWSASDVGAGFTHVAVVDGLVYVTGLVGTAGFLSAYTADGELKWRETYGPEWSEAHPGSRSIPTVHDGRVYIISGVGNMVCFDAADGRRIWSRTLFEDYQALQLMWGYAESVLVDGDNVIATPCAEKATMVALDRRTGDEVWSSPALGQGSSYCSPLLVEHGGRRLIVTQTEPAVVAFSAADGTVAWQHPYENARKNHCVTPIHQGDMLYVTSGYGKGAIGLVLAEDGGSVTQVWEQPRQDPVHGQAVLVDGYVYASSHQRAGGKWSCVELTTGRQAWEDVGVGRGGSVIYADGMLYCYSEDGMLGLVRPTPEKCDVVCAFPVTDGDGPHWAHPVVADGRLYVRHGNALMCYSIADG